MQTIENSPNVFSIGLTDIGKNPDGKISLAYFSSTNSFLGLDRSYICSLTNDSPLPFLEFGEELYHIFQRLVPEFGLINNKEYEAKVASFLACYDADCGIMNHSEGVNDFVSFIFSNCNYTINNKSTFRFFHANLPLIKFVYIVGGIKFQLQFIDSKLPDYKDPVPMLRKRLEAEIIRYEYKQFNQSATQ